MIPTAALLTSELVTNAVVHVGGTITVRACCDNDHLVRVEVHDQSPVSPATGTKALEALGGRGLHLVDAMAEAWGSRTTGSGKVVWFELSRDGVVRRLPGV
jgi:anti-sigma regulatory factor (Ser/Thr protein kinase)